MTLVICALGVSAQNTKVITGAVIDKNGNPLPNALVEATGGAESVSTDADGSFRIEVPIWLKSLTAKYAGFKEKKIKLKNTNQVIFEMKPVGGSWFLNLAGSADFGDFVYGRIGLMAGYLDNWGGYARLMAPIEDNFVPSFTAGVTKRVAKPVYLYLGVGYTPVYGEEYYGYGYYEHDYEDGVMVELGTIIRINKINFSVGYAFSKSHYYENNHSLQLSIGYCFR